MKINFHNMLHVVYIDTTNNVIMIPMILIMFMLLYFINKLLTYFSIYYRPSALSMESLNKILNNVLTFDILKCS